ncbi:hypothetical protein [Achromobacter spanius]|uniref:Uncharacterized protein n=1 Tax=Achromobacter spanius TaxID=217203 RepID=A0A2S0I1S1_9BURK|nr:hypothetical protein [Achromobacter spanius]AVJ25963.1 hypothetical protein CLM73_01860 [Achromobacter spanius]
MALLTLNRKHLELAATRETDRQLIQYIRGALAAVLPRLPASQALIPPYVQKAGRHAIESGFGEGGYYSFHILTGLLLGPSWDRDPFLLRRFDEYLDAPGMEPGARIALAMDAVLDTRRALEAALPELIDVAVQSLSIPPERFTPEHIWLAFERMAHIRGCQPHQILPLFERFETGFRLGNGLPPVHREKLPGHIQVAYEAQGIPLPKPSDAIRDLDRLQLQNFHGSLLLALIYGQSFSNNLFLVRIVQKLDAALQPPDYQHELKGFLRSHREALMEKVIE